MQQSIWMFGRALLVLTLLPDIGSAAAEPVVFPPDTPTTATILHTILPNSGSWSLEAPHEFSSPAILYNSSTSATLALAPLVYLLRFNNGGRVQRESSLTMVLPSGQTRVLQVGRRASKIYAPRNDWYFQGGASASSYGYAGAYASVSVTALNYTLNLGGTGASATSAGLSDSSSSSFSGIMVPGIVHQAVATVSVQVNVFRGGSAYGSAYVGFFNPEGSLGGASASASFYGAWQTVEIPGQPLDDLDTIPEGDWWMMK